MENCLCSAILESKNFGISITYTTKGSYIDFIHLMMMQSSKLIYVVQTCMWKNYTFRPFSVYIHQNRVNSTVLHQNDRTLHKLKLNDFNWIVTLNYTCLFKFYVGIIQT